MDYHPKNLKKKNSNILEKFYKKSKKLSECSSKINVEHNMNRDFDNKTLNLFKGIVKIKNTSSKKKIKEQNIESNSANNKNIFQFTNFLYNNEEHLHKNQIHILKNSENNPSQKDILSPIKSFTHKLSINEKYFKNSKRTMKLSKEKNESDIKKDLFKRSSYNLSGLSLKKKSHKNLFIKNKIGNSTNTNHKSHKDYSFFSKLKEKEKNPSKTPYLDTKFWKTSYDVTKFVTNDTNSKSPIHKRSSKMSLFNKSQSPKKKKNYVDENDNNNKEKIFINKESIKKSLVNDKDDNNAIIVNKKDLQKKEIKRHENNDNSNESEYCLECKKKGNNISSIIVNILNKPFFCCLKP